MSFWPGLMGRAKAGFGAISFEFPASLHQAQSCISGIPFSVAVCIHLIYHFETVLAKIVTFSRFINTNRF